MFMYVGVTGQCRSRKVDHLEEKGRERVVAILRF
jgi:hypothetical protein